MGDVNFALLLEIRPDLQVTRVGSGFTIDDARVGGGTHVAFLGFGGFGEQFLQGLRVGFKLESLVYLFTNFLHWNGRVIAKEITGRAKITFGHGIVPADHGIVWALEESILAVMYKLRGLAPVAGAELGRVAHGGDGGRGDVILGNDFHSRLEILAQTIEPPAFGGVEADTQEIGFQLHSIEAQLVAGLAIHSIHSEPAFPIVAPILTVFALDDEGQFLHMRRNGAQPVVVLISVHSVRRRKQFDD